MDGSSSLKRPRDGELSGSSQHQRVEGHTSGGFASGPAGRRHLRFTDTTQEVHNQAHDQAGSSRQGDAQLGPKDRKTIEDYTKLILSDDAKIWSNSIGDVDTKHKETRRQQQEAGQTQGTNSQSLPEIWQPLDKEKKEVIDIPSNADSESDHGRTDHQADISKAREEHIKKVIDIIMKNEGKFPRKDIRQFLEDNKLCSTDCVEIAIKHLKENWSSHRHSNRYNNIIFAINGIK